MKSTRLEALVDEPTYQSSVLTLDSPQTPSRDGSIDGIAAEHPQSTRTGNETIHNGLASLYRRGQRVPSQIKSRFLRGTRRAVLATTLAGLLAACGAAGFYTHKDSRGVKVAYPPDFSCDKISIDYGTTINLFGRIMPHPGIDVIGKIVIAPADGVVRLIVYDEGAGHEVLLRHSPQDLGTLDTYSITWYSH